MWDTQTQQSGRSRRRILNWTDVGQAGRRVGRQAVRRALAVLAAKTFVCFETHMPPLSAPPAQPLSLGSLCALLSASEWNILACETNIRSHVLKLLRRCRCRRSALATELLLLLLLFISFSYAVFFFLSRKLCEYFFIVRTFLTFFVLFTYSTFCCCFLRHFYLHVRWMCVCVWVYLLVAFFGCWHTHTHTL